MRGHMLLSNMYDEATSKLLPHSGHSVVVMAYSHEVSVECDDCGQVLLTFPAEQDPEIKDAMGYFSYCLACKKAVPDVSNPCTGCNSAKDMVDWVEPSRDCTMLIDGKDCIERGWDSDEVICLACASWLKWEQARPKR